MKDIIVHQVNVAHYRLIELSKLADQAKPFYDWVERIAKQISGYNKSFSEILLTCNKSQIKQIISSDIVFHFNMNPNKFVGFDDETQQKLNKYIESLFKPDSNEK
jgi:hypothetical protein